MAKAKKVTKSAIEQMFCGKKDDAVSIRVGNDENGIDVLVKKSLSLYERGEMVRSVVDTIFNVDDDGYNYHPYMKTFALDAHVVIYFTDIKLPSDAEKAHCFIEQSEIVYRIADVLPAGYLGDIAREVDELLEFKKAQAAKKSKLDGLIESAADLIAALQKKLDGMNVNDLISLVAENVPELKGELESILAAEMGTEVTE